MDCIASLPLVNFKKKPYCISPKYGDEEGKRIEDVVDFIFSEFITMVAKGQDSEVEVNE